MNEITDEIDNATSMYTNSITHGLCERPFSDRLAESATNVWSN